MEYCSPFILSLDPMERLLLINITADPDEVYAGFEPQVFDDPINGRGLIVLAYLHDGRFDVYHQPGVLLAGRNYDIVGKGLREAAERPMTGARFDITPTGIHLDVAFDDLLGRPVALRILEKGGKRTRPFGILAPMGNTVERPPALPLFFLHDFYFVRRAGTDLLISVDGRAHKPDSIPMILDGARVHFIRYSAAPLLATWNATSDEMPNNGTLRPLRVDAGTDGAGRAADGPVVYDFAARDGRPALATMSVSGSHHALHITFDPPFPDVTALLDGKTVAGTFVVESGTCGTVGGRYQTTRTSDTIDIMLHPSGGWRPGPVQWGARLIFTIVPLFRKWPATYVWHGRVTLGGDYPRLRGAWQRSAAVAQGAVKLFGE